MSPTRMAAVKKNGILKRWWECSPNRMFIDCERDNRLIQLLGKNHLAWSTKVEHMCNSVEQFYYLGICLREISYEYIKNMKETVTAILFFIAEN